MASDPPVGRRADGGLPEPEQPVRISWCDATKKSIPAGVLIAVAGVVIGESLRLGLGSTSEPGPGLWLCTVAVVLLVLAGVLRGTEVERVTGNELRTLGLGIVLMLLFVVLFSMWGVLVPALITLIAWLLVLARRRVVTSVAVGAVAALCLYGIFVLGLGVV